MGNFEFFEFTVELWATYCCVVVIGLYWEWPLFLREKKTLVWIMSVWSVAMIIWGIGVSLKVLWEIRYVAFDYWNRNY